MGFHKYVAPLALEMPGPLSFHALPRREAPARPKTS